MSPETTNSVRRPATAPRRSDGASTHPARGIELLSGECVETLATLAAASVDAVITDPPYGIGFQNERWDGRAIVEAAARAGGERLSANEAFEVWCSHWGEGCLRAMKPGAHLLAFGSPRTWHRLTAGLEDAGFEIRDTLMWVYGTGMPKSRRYPSDRATALKPAFEPIVLARRPLAGTVAQNVRRHGTGLLEVGECRVGDRHPADVIVSHEIECEAGRCVTGCAAALLDTSAEHGRVASGRRTPPSRFLYCPKPSRTERDAGCQDLPRRSLDLFPNAKGAGQTADARNPHPTVKPLELLRWLVRLVCPPDGLVLDPFTGSGTTGAAVAIEGRRFLGIELEPDYLEIAAARIAHWSEQTPDGAPPSRGPR